MYILVLNAYHGDSAACIYKDGLLIAASEEERFTRIKHWAGFPALAIEFCLKEAEITLIELDYIVISRDPKANLGRKAWTAFKNQLSIRNIVNRLKNLKKAASIEEEFYTFFKLNAGTLKAKFINIEHHRSHLASAFFASPFEQAAVLSIDGFGDYSSTMTGKGNKTKIDVLQTVSYPHSLGVFYTTFTQLMGFPNYGDEYKVMGMAPYGKPLYVEKLREVLLLKDNGTFELNLSYFNHPKKGVKMAWENGTPSLDNLFTAKLIAEFGDVRKVDDPLTQYHYDLAASVQRATEDCIFHILIHLHQQTGLDCLCIAGGVAQNSVANGKILQNTPFKQLYIPPAGHDAGTAIGAAMWLYHQLLNKPRSAPMLHGNFGSKFGDGEIEKLLIERNLNYKKLDDKSLNDEVSDCLINGGIVGWFQGRAEFGPRALGYRSILADPRRVDAKEILNLRIKRRESFRPFAPSILKEHTSAFFESPDVVPFMEKVFKIKEEKRALIPAVTHVDGTGRLQTVDQKINPKYYHLIVSFYQKTGVPILLNTSFNENEPIVNKPSEALDCFLRTKMDMLVMGNIMLKREAVEE